jgi:hypothetical protein
MSDREDRLRSLLDKVRAKRPEERITRAGDAVERIRTASGTTAAAAAAPGAPPVPPHMTPVPSAFPTQAAPEPLPDPPTTPGLESPTRYSSKPPGVERPLSSHPAARITRASSGSVPSLSSSSPEAIRPHSVSPSAGPVVVSTDAPEFPRPSTFGELLELTLSLRPR